MPFSGDECLIWPFVRNKWGYAIIQIDGKKRPVPQVVCEAVHGPAPSPDHETAHNCGKGAAGCINPRHLRWATHPENMADRVRHGTMAWGEQHGMAKLDEAAVVEIRRLKGQLLQREIAAMFGVTRHMVGKILSGKNWRHVPF